MHQESHTDEKQERLKEKLRDELGSTIVGLLDKSSGLEDIIVNEDSRIWVKRTGSPFEQVGELSSRQARGAMMTIASMQKTTVPFDPFFTLRPSWFHAYIPATLDAEGICLAISRQLEKE